MDDTFYNAKEKEIEDYFTYHKPKGNQPEKYEKIRAKLKESAFLIDRLCPEGHDKQLAFGYLRKVCMWANASIALKNDT